MSEFAYPKPKARARAAILDYIFQFSIAKSVLGAQQAVVLHDHWFLYTEDPAIGSLVVQQSAPLSKWRLSWVIDKEPLTKENYFSRQILLESVEDGELCNWRNTSYVEYPQAQEHPSWRWSDAQFAFADRWRRTFRDEHMVKPIDPRFDGNSVTLSMRYWMDLRTERPEKTFPDWRKVTKASMGEWFTQAKQEYEPKP